jgi:CheY-like chemotaxis protein
MNTILNDIDRTEILDATSPIVPVLPRSKKRILLADDSPQIRESLGKLLRSVNYEVIFAAHGGQVLDLTFNEDFDLLLLDLNMPEMDGWDALDRLASMKPTLPIIVITAQPNQRDWIVTAGAHALMEKPLDLPLLLQTIEDFLLSPPVLRPDRTTGKRERFRYGWPRRQSTAADQALTRGGINE